MWRNVTENSCRFGKSEKKVIPWTVLLFIRKFSVGTNHSICFPTGTTGFSIQIVNTPFVCYSQNSCGLVAHLIGDYTMTCHNQIKVFTVFDLHSKLSRLILNQFDSSTEERIFEMNNEINIAIMN